MKFIQFCVLMIFVAYSYADANLQKFACDGKIMELECKSGGFLIIMNATFGRVSNNICPDKTLVDFITCRAENTYDKVKALCNGKQRCTINATNTYFGDACPGLSKYLEVQYKCRNGGSIDIDDEQSSSQTTTTTTEEPDISIEIETRPPNLGPAVLSHLTDKRPIMLTASSQMAKKSIACQGSDLEMVCNKGELIHILEASYGGASETVCAHNYSPKRTCVPMDISKKVISRCVGETRCKVTAANKFLGNPCPHVFKVAEVKYKCSKGLDAGSHLFYFMALLISTVSTKLLVQETLACETTLLSMSCPEGYKVRVLTGDYGRSSDFICSYGDHNKNLDCHSANALRIMRKRCKGQSKCEIEATNTVFGDPCPSTIKYAEATYKCVKKHKSSSTYSRQSNDMNEVNKFSNSVFK
ncbi:Calcium-independent receptor for alpha-latrotoxin [Carabus blaptoides fortunei]